MLLEGIRGERDCGEGCDGREGERVCVRAIPAAFVSSSSGWLGYFEVVREVICFVSVWIGWEAESGAGAVGRRQWSRMAFVFTY